MMLQIDDIILTTDLLTQRFCCDLSICKGSCCVEGDAGAPLLEEEILELEEAYEVIAEELPTAAREVIESQGVADIDIDGELVTSIVNDKECVFAYQQEDGIWKCAIERAYNQERVSFQKPVSCHLYPLRIKQIGELTAINYHKWDVCTLSTLSPNALPLYVILKEPLIRRFGTEFYTKLEEAANHINE